MKRQILILTVLLIILYSCGNKENEYFHTEYKIVNEKIYFNISKIQERYFLNPEMAEPYFKTASFLNASFDSIFHSIDNEDTKEIHNRLTDLYSDIERSSYFSSEYIHEIIIPNRFNKWINNNDDNSFIANRKILKLDLLNLKNELTSYLYYSIEADYYKFNKLSVVVLDSSDNIKVGDTYQAKIVLAVEDTTMYPSIIFANISQPDSVFNSIRADSKSTFYMDVIDGKGVYRKKIHRRGKHGFKGVVQIPNAYGELERFKFSKEFTVKN
nr:hypothetical protein [uncultured Draconibacterium sp.]